MTPANEFRASNQGKIAMLGNRLLDLRVEVIREGDSFRIQDDGVLFVPRGREDRRVTSAFASVLLADGTVFSSMMDWQRTLAAANRNAIWKGHFNALAKASAVGKVLDRALDHYRIQLQGDAA